MTGRQTPTVTRDDIARGLRGLGLEPGDGVLVHASLSSFGHVSGGADAVVDAILDCIGDAGTAVFPTFTGDAVCGAILGVSGHQGAVIFPEAADVDLDDLRNIKEHHIFTGAIARAAWRRADFLKGTHPFYSICARGPLARELVDFTDRYIFYSAEDKFIHRLGQLGGKTLLLGCSHISNSSIHVVAEIAGLEYKVQDRPYWKVTVDEYLAMPRERQAELLRAHCAMNLPYDIEKRYGRIEPELIRENAIRIGRIGAAEVRLMGIADFVRIGLAAVRKNPWLLADKVPKVD
ncbi:MAG TPA: AAC(3) family N-acetyltransferase [Planctomycetota bacterium]|nr:AAC(3) family N-acetyltransferase [Planctomycetota bacterium]